MSLHSRGHQGSGRKDKSIRLPGKNVYYSTRQLSIQERISVLYYCIFKRCIGHPKIQNSFVQKMKFAGLQHHRYFLCNQSVCIVACVEEEKETIEKVFIQILYSLTHTHTHTKKSGWVPSSHIFPPIASRVRMSWVRCCYNCHLHSQNSVPT